MKFRAAHDLFSFRWQATALAVAMLLIANRAASQSFQPDTLAPALPPVTIPHEPLSGTPNQWTYIPVAGTLFMTQNYTAIQGGLVFNPAPATVNGNPNPNSDKVVIFMGGGGACWDFTSCVTLRSATLVPCNGSTCQYGQTEFDNTDKPNLAHGLLDRSVAKNPFNDWNLVYIPYFTGDLHGGNADATYNDAIFGTRNFKHAGHRNLLAMLGRIVATWPAPHIPSKVVVTGASAGGYGAALNYDTIRPLFPSSTKMYMLDDGGAMLEGSNMVNLGKFINSWRLGDLLNSFCTGCTTDMSKVFRSVANKYPVDRFAHTVASQDFVLRFFLFALSVDGPTFEQLVLNMARHSAAAAANFHYYVYTPSDHNQDHCPAAHPINISNPPTVDYVMTRDGINYPLWDWLSAFANDGNGWPSVPVP